MAENDLFKELYNLIQKVEGTNRVVIQLGERLVSISDRIEKTEDATAGIIIDTKKTEGSKYKEENCPFKFKMETYDEYCKDQEQRINSLEKGLSYYKGAVWALGGLIAISIPLVIFIISRIG